MMMIGHYNSHRPPRTSSSRRKLIPIVRIVYVMVILLILLCLVSNLKFILENNSNNSHNNNNLIDIVKDSISTTMKHSNDDHYHHLSSSHSDAFFNNNNQRTKLSTSKSPAILSVSSSQQQQHQRNEEEEEVLAPSRLPHLRNSLPTGECAILFFGLPRSFQQYVLPSLEQHVIQPNLKYHCDYYVHYYDQSSEASGRSGQGGSIQSNDIYLLQDSIHKLYNQNQTQHHDNHNNTIDGLTIEFISDTNETFFEKRKEEIQKYRTTKENYPTRHGSSLLRKRKKKKSPNNLLYFPYQEQTYEYPKTMDNIVRQWHSIEEVWKLMERNNYQTKKKKKYTRIAMLRNDVIYITPIDIYKVPKVSASHDYDYDGDNNRRSVIPNFCKWPINDRLMYGPYAAVEIWASQRFQHIDHYAHNNYTTASSTHPNNSILQPIIPITYPNSIPGKVMHSETFLNASILHRIKHTPYYNNNQNTDHHHPQLQPLQQQLQPQPQQLYYEIVEDAYLCFLRVRADGAIWIEDCDASKSSNNQDGYPGGMEIYRELLYDTIHTNNCTQRTVPDPVRIILELMCTK